MAQILTWDTPPLSGEIPWSVVECPSIRAIHDYLQPCSTILISSRMMRFKPVARYLALVRLRFPGSCVAVVDGKDIPEPFTSVAQEELVSFLASRVDRFFQVRDDRLFIKSIEQFLSMLELHAPGRFPLDTVVFDMDGTLVKSDVYSAAGVQDAIRSLFDELNIRKDVPSPAQIVARLGIDSDHFYRELLEHHAEDHADRLRQLARQGILKRVSEGEGILFPNVEETLDRLREMGLKLGLVSSSSPEYFYTVNHYHGLDRHFDFRRCTGEREGATKKDVLADAIQTLGSRHTLMIGDRHQDIDAGIVHNCHTMGATWGFGAAGELNTADYRPVRFSEIAHLIKSDFQIHPIESSKNRLT